MLDTLPPSENPAIGTTRPDDTGGRSAARTMLEQILAKCDGIPGLVSLLTSALSLIATLA